MMDAILFRSRLDVARLRAELAAAVAATPWIDKPERGRYLRWSAIALHSQHGSMDEDTVDLHVPITMAQDCAPTPALAHCPYIAELLGSFAAAKLRVRLMQLAAGGHIGRHRDRQYGWALPILRLHVPIVTDDGVEFLLAGRRIDMQPGELWYLDTTQEHEVTNRGTTDRVHLVIDLVNGPALRAQLGPETWAAWHAPADPP